MHENGRELSAGASGQASSILSHEAERSEQALNVSVLCKAGKTGNIRKHHVLQLSATFNTRKHARHWQRHPSLNRPHDRMSTFSNTSRSKDSGAANPVPVLLVGVPLRAVHTSGRPKQSSVLTWSHNQNWLSFSCVRLWRYDCSHITCASKTYRNFIRIKTFNLSATWPTLWNFPAPILNLLPSIHHGLRNNKNQTNLIRHLETHRKG